MAILVFIKLLLVFSCFVCFNPCNAHYFNMFHPPHFHSHHETSLFVWLNLVSIVYQPLVDSAARMPISNQTFTQVKDHIGKALWWTSTSSASWRGRVHPACSNWGRVPFETDLISSCCCWKRTSLTSDRFQVGPRGEWKCKRHLLYLFTLLQVLPFSKC